MSRKHQKSSKILLDNRGRSKAPNVLRSIRPLTAPHVASQYVMVPPRASVDEDGNHGNRPKSTLGFSTTTRPVSARSGQSNEQSTSSPVQNTISSSSRRYKSKIDKTSPGSARGLRRKSMKPKITVAWDNGKSNDTGISDERAKNKVSFQPRTGRSALKSNYKASSLVPGFLSTMISVVESEEEKEDDDTAMDKKPVPCFADVATSDGSSEYDTDLEEDFPAQPKEFDPSGRTTYMKMCVDKDLVPVSYLSERLKNNEIVMRHHGLGSVGTIPLAKSLKKNTYIEKIDLSDNYIEGPGAVSLANMLHDNCFITDIDLSMNFIRSEGGTAFAEMLYKNQFLKKLVLKSNHLTDKDAKVFADAIKENRTLEYLDISHNEIGEMGGIYLGAGLAANYGLRHFDVSWNCIRFKGAVGLAQSLKNNDCLRHFNMSWNGLSLLGCVALGRFLKKNEALVELDISNNRIGLLGTQKLAAGIASHPNLRILKIGRNPMGDGGVECLLNVVKSHNTIKFLSLEDITVSPKVFDEIKDLEAERNVTIITGGIGGYKRPKEMPPGMRILLDFISDNRLRLIDWFNQFDKDHSGGISREEFRKGLKEIGLVMTTRQLDRLIEFIDFNDDGEIEYSELLRGREMTIQQLRTEKKIEERNKQIEEKRMRLPKLEGYDYDLM